jgi:hypothetical protein
MLYGSAVVWSSRQQRTVALSTAEAEYYALGDLARDIKWFRQLLSDLGNPLSDPTPAREDSRSAMKWAKDSASWSKTRHIDVIAHKLREWIDQKVLKVEYCPTTAQLADVLTKALPNAQHQRMKMFLLGEAYKWFEEHNPPFSPAA